MIAYLSGKVLKISEKGIILKTDKIGYYINLNSHTLSELNENQDLELFIHSHIREDDFSLYGFKNFNELEFFKLLLSINGIGPKVALEICNLPTEKVKSAIVNEDVAFICTIPGIGKKTAQRLILELKNKVNLENVDSLKQNSSVFQNEDVIDALISLGYQRKHVINTLQKLPDEISSEQEIITYFLKSA